MKEFKKPNVKAPRFRPAVYSILNQEFFDKFKQAYPEHKTLDNTVIKNIIKTFNISVYQNVIDNRDGIQLPEQVGWLFIGSCQQSKKKNVDFAKSLKYGITVTNNNFDTDGKLAKIFFTSFAPKHKMKNREFWSFVACREFKRAVAKTYAENWNMYVAIDSTKKLNTTYAKGYYKNRAEFKTKQALTTYNEFDL
jgi:hypothetical protein